MSRLSARKISSFLTSRLPSVKKETLQPTHSAPHHRWDEASKASLVILWGLLVYPQLDPESKNRGRPAMHKEEIYRLFKEHLGTQTQWEGMLTQLRDYDYVRFTHDGSITAGTRLWTAVDGAKMYRVFRSSNLSRQEWLREKKDKQD